MCACVCTVCVCVSAYGSSSLLMCLSVLVSIHASNQTTAQTQRKVKDFASISLPPPLPTVCAHLCACVPCTALFKYFWFYNYFSSLYQTCMPTFAHRLYPLPYTHTHSRTHTLQCKCESSLSPHSCIYTITIYLSHLGADLPTRTKLHNFQRAQMGVQISAGGLLTIQMFFCC